ncbi:hypothetical protein ACFQ2H_07525 [Streptomyces violaceoruber]
MHSGSDAVTEVPPGRWDVPADAAPGSGSGGGAGRSWTVSTGSTPDSSASRRVRPPRWTRSSGSCSN